VECAGSNYFLNLRGHETREIHRFPNFGNLGGYGVGVARAEWLKTPAIRPEIVLDEFVIMTNHMHAIVTIT
jgi:hypothetical protein